MNIVNSFESVFQLIEFILQCLHDSNEGIWHKLPLKVSDASEEVFAAFILFYNEY